MVQKSNSSNECKVNERLCIPGVKAESIRSIKEGTFGKLKLSCPASGRPAFSISLWACFMFTDPVHVTVSSLGEELGGVGSVLCEH